MALVPPTDPELRRVPAVAGQPPVVVREGREAVTVGRRPSTAGQLDEPLEAGPTSVHRRRVVEAWLREVAVIVPNAQDQLLEEGAGLRANDPVSVLDVRPVATAVLERPRSVLVTALRVAAAVVAVSSLLQLVEAADAGVAVLAPDIGVTSPRRTSVVVAVASGSVRQVLEARVTRVRVVPTLPRRPTHPAEDAPRGTRTGPFTGVPVPRAHWRRGVVVGWLGNTAATTSRDSTTHAPQWPRLRMLLIELTTAA